MRCLSCHKLSIDIICIRCKKELFKPNISRRKLGSLEVVSLFKYKNIEPFVLTKHTSIGYRMYKYFSKNHIKPFMDEFAMHIDEAVTLVPIDEQVDSGYSHTALLSHYASSPKIKLSHGTLLAKNKIKYAGKSLNFRISNPRNFQYRGRKNIEAILIDDIITTGSTIQQAQHELSKHNIEVLFAITLADARD